MHDGIKNHQCDKCDEAFCTDFDLRKHKSNDHDKERNHRCSTCEKSFKSNSHLKRHISRVHQGEKNDKRWVLNRYD